MLVVLALAAGPVQAQNQKVEISGTGGWTFSDGVSGDPLLLPGVGTFDRIDPKDAFSWGVRLGFMVTPNVEIGALYNQQSTKLQIGGTETIELGDMSVHNYHGYFAYNFGETDAAARPYLLLGLGATQFGAVSATAGNAQREIGGTTKFSPTLGAGLKVYPGKSVGFRLEGRWTPTYIKSDASGWWCDPYWGCYVTQNAQYSNQFELAGGINFRF
jgi:opacity protein-like surface antigen